MSNIPKELTDFIPRRSPNSLFGRGSVIKELRRELKTNGETVLVSGMVGIGKTAIVEAYTYKYYSKYSHIAWITDFENNLPLSISHHKKILQIFKLQDTRFSSMELFIAVTRRMKDLENEPCLLIVEETSSDVIKYRNYLPFPPNWHLIFISRQSFEGVKEIKISEIPEDFATRLFRTICPSITDEEKIGALLHEIDYHTLTIEILAGTAEYQQIPIEELYATIKKDFPSNIQLPHDNSEGAERVYEYLTKVFDMSSLNEDEEWVMKQFCFLPPEYISIEVIENLFLPEKAGLKRNFRQTLMFLFKKGWLQKKSNESDFKMHRIISKVGIELLSPELHEILPLINRISEKLSYNQLFDNPIDKFPWLSFGIFLGERIEKLGYMDLEEIFSFRNNLGIIMTMAGDYVGAKKLLTKAMASDEANFGESHPKTAVSYSNLALVLQDLGDYESAKKLLEKAMASDEANFGESHPETAKKYSNLATVLQDLGDYQGAKKLLEKAMASDEANFGESHPKTAVSYSNLALVLQDLGDYVGAKKLLTKAMASDEANFGESHPSTAVLYSNLATVLQDLGDYQGAKKLLEKAMASDEANYGESHPTTAGRYYNLALVLKALGDYQGAKKLLQKAMASAEANFGEEHPNTAVSYASLASVLQALGDYQGAKKLLQKAASALEGQLGPDHPKTKIAIKNLQSLLKEMGELPEEPT